MQTDAIRVAKCVPIKRSITCSANTAIFTLRSLTRRKDKSNSDGNSNFNSKMWIYAVVNIRLRFKFLIKAGKKSAAPGGGTKCRSDPHAISVQRRSPIEVTITKLQKAYYQLTRNCRSITRPPGSLVVFGSLYAEPVGNCPKVEVQHPDAAVLAAHPPTLKLGVFSRFRAFALNSKLCVSPMAILLLRPRSTLKNFGPWITRFVKPQPAPLYTCWQFP